MIPLRYETAQTVMVGPFLDESDGDTPLTELDIAQSSIKLSKVGGAYAQKHEESSALHDSGGEYAIALDTTDTNTRGRMRMKIIATGALPVWENFVVLSQDAYDKLYGSDVFAGDPLLSLVPGSYAAGTAGYQIGRIGSAEATISAPINQTLDLTIVQGDDYNASDGRQIDFTYTGLPTIAGATVAFRYIGEGQTSATSIAMSIVSSGGASQVVRLQLTNTQTDAMPVGRGEYDIQITLATSSRVITPTNRAKLIVSSDI